MVPEWEEFLVVWEVPDGGDGVSARSTRFDGRGGG